MSTKPTMLAAVFHGRGDIRITEVPVPTPGDDELLLRIATAGICGTDVHEYATGPHMFPVDRTHPVSGHSGPFVPGHEFAGYVVAKGSAVSGFEVGALVTSGAGISCGECYWCRRGASNLCATYITVGLQVAGGLAQYAVVPADICVEVNSNGLGPDVAALAQPMSVAVHAMRRGRLEAGEVALIVGAGGIGAFLTYAASQSGARVIVLDLDENRLDIALELGASQVIHPGPGLSLDEVLADEQVIPAVIYEVTGTEAGLQLALDTAQPGTRIVLVGIQDRSIELEFSRITLGEIELIGTNAHTFGDDFPEALRLLASRADGWADIAPIVIPLANLVDDGLVPVVEGRARRIKTLIDPWSDTTRVTDR